MERVITGIQVQARNTNRVSLDLDGEYAFGLSRVVAAWLKVGDRLSEEKISQLKIQDSTEVAYLRAISLLNHRPRTEKEITDRLQEKGFDVVQVETVLSRLRNEGLVRDEQFAKSWVENRNVFHPRGQRLLRRELKQKGIADELIDNALVDSEDESVLAARAAEQYARRLSELDWMTFRKRLSGFLARRGFSYGVIFPVVRSMWENLGPKPVITRKNEEFENDITT